MVEETKKVYTEDDYEYGNYTAEEFFKVSDEAFEALYGKKYKVKKQLELDLQ